jgi:hypothetical protein
LAELKTLGHSLPKCCDAFKTQADDAALNNFDNVISEIHKYEDLRYPDEKSKGYAVNVRHCAVDTSNHCRHAASTVPSYKLCLQDVDELIAAIVAAASINPEVNLRFMKEEANEYVVRENKQATLTKGASQALLAKPKPPLQ